MEIAEAKVPDWNRVYALESGGIVVFIVGALCAKQLAIGRELVPLASGTRVKRKVGVLGGIGNPRLKSAFGTVLVA